MGTGLCLLPRTFVAPPPAARSAVTTPLRNAVALAARGGGEYDVSDADIEAFYQETMTGAGGNPPKGTVTAELIVKHFHGEWDDKGQFTRYSGQWQGPPRGTIGKNVIKGGPGNDETQKVVDDGKGWVWLAADMSP